MNQDRRRIIFLASREAGYSRVRVMGDALRSCFSVTEILSIRRSYPVRMIEVLWRFVFRRQRRADVLVVGFLAQPLLPILRRLWKGPLVSDAFISLKDTLVEDRKRGVPGGLIDRLATTLDRFLVKNSDLVFCDTQAHAAYFQSRFGPTQARFQRVWVGAPDLSTGVRCWRKPDRLDGPLRIFFYGSFIPLQGTDVIVEAARRISAGEVVFRLAGEGPLWGRAKTAAAGLDHVTFLGWQTEARLIEEMLQADLCLGIFGASPKASRVIPNKAYSALQLGAPLLTGDNPAIRELLHPGVDVVISRMNDPEALVESLRWCASHREALARIGAAGAEVFRREASTERLAGTMARAIDELLECSPGEGGVL